MEMCQDESQCTLTATDDTYGDPCFFARHHYLEVIYECVTKINTPGYNFKQKNATWQKDTHNIRDKETTLHEQLLTRCFLFSYMCILLSCCIITIIFFFEVVLIFLKQVIIDLRFNVPKCIIIIPRSIV